MWIDDGSLDLLSFTKMLNISNRDCDPRVSSRKCEESAKYTWIRRENLCDEAFLAKKSSRWTFTTSAVELGNQITDCIQG